MANVICYAGSAASVPFCVMADAGHGLRRGVLDRNTLHGLLHWMGALHFSEVSTPYINRDPAADHRSVSAAMSFPCWLKCGDRSHTGPVLALETGRCPLGVQSSSQAFHVLCLENLR